MEANADRRVGSSCRCAYGSSIGSGSFRVALVPLSVEETQSRNVRSSAAWRASSIQALARRHMLRPVITDPGDFMDGIWGSH